MSPLERWKAGGEIAWRPEARTLAILCWELVKHPNPGENRSGPAFFALSPGRRSGDRRPRPAL